MRSNLHRQWTFVFLLIVLAIITPHRVAADPTHEADTAIWITKDPASIDGFVPTPWLCGGINPGAQSMAQFHQNWHCTNGPGSTNFGNRFFGFHKQFIFGYNHFLASIGEKSVKTWEPFHGHEIPPGHQNPPALDGRKPGTPCDNCIALPDKYRLPALSTTFLTIDALGRDLSPNWHGTNHINIAAAGGTRTCSGAFPDMQCPDFAARDAIFYQYHHIFDDIQDAWRTFQPTDIAIVLDRSGSMGAPFTPGVTRLEGAKDAAILFADLFEAGTNHELGMISFATTASSSPDMPLTIVSNAPAALSAALSGIVADGATNIGDGLLKAQNLINSGSRPRKAILLLTDGEENQTPEIKNVALGDTHVCSIGFGIPGISSAKLQPLSERQGGIYLTGDKAIELKKFFVFCFANIFDTPVAEDPIDVLPAGQFISSPTIHHAFMDEKLVFVLGWTNPSRPGTLQLAITTPFGDVLDLNAPGVESKFGPTWHIVRFKLPHNSERDGNWTARAIRPIRTYVNGFSSKSFANFEQGVTLVQNELATLCTNGCRNILYYEDQSNQTDNTDFGEHRSIYGSALFTQLSLSNIIRPANAFEFRDALQRGGNGERGFDLVVYSSQYTESEQPYDELLARVICTNHTRAIISDNRHTEGAKAILLCGGALRGNSTNFNTLVSSDSSRLLDLPAQLRSPLNVYDFSYELLLAKGAAPQVISTTNAIAVVAQGEAGRDEEFFITVLARSTSKVKPFKDRNNTYTLEDLHPTFHIPSPYWPTCGFDKVYATVNVTRPLRSLSGLLASVGSTNGSIFQGDTMTPREVAAQALAKKNITIPTETKQYQLYDDGTHGDSSANDHYWEVSLPPDFAAVDGDYQLHAFFRLCKIEGCGREKCVEREAHQIITVRAQMDLESKVVVEKLSDHGRVRILITPADKRGNLLGLGLVDELLLTPIGDVKIESKSDLDGRGTYEIIVNWVMRDGEKPELIISQFGRPENAIQIELGQWFSKAQYAEMVY